jgi:hypothetical protein
LLPARCWLVVDRGRVVGVQPSAPANSNRHATHLLLPGWCAAAAVPHHRHRHCCLLRLLCRSLRHAAGLLCLQGVVLAGLGLARCACACGGECTGVAAAAASRDGGREVGDHGEVRAE